MSTRNNSVECYYGVAKVYEAKELTPLQWQTYELLWHFGPLSVQRLNTKAQETHGHNPNPPWGDQLKKLRALGLVAIVGRLWDVTGVVSPVVRTGGMHRPKRKMYVCGVEDIELALIRGESAGLYTEAAREVLLWLQSKLPKK
jgi:hypothetical protein